MASQVTGYDTAKDLWEALQEYYGLQVASQQDYFKRMLQQTRKGSIKMSDYLALMKGYADNLYLAGSPVSTQDLISYVIARLDEEYTPIVVVLQNQDLSWTAVQNRLITCKNRQEQIQLSKGLVSINQPSAHVATSNSNQGSPNQQQNRNTNKNYRSRGRGRGGNTPRLICQVYGKPGHSTTICYYRFEKNFNSPQNSGNSSSFNQNKNSTPTALIAILEHLHDSAWYLDSGATNHLTLDLANLTVKSKYTGNDMIIVGNGQLLPIRCIGSINIRENARNIVLKSLMHVPLIRKNLISISRLTMDDLVIVDFYDSFCAIKDKETGKVFLERTIKDDLYQVKDSLNQKESRSLWVEI